MQELIKIAIDQAKESIVIITNHFSKGKEPTIAYANKEFLENVGYSLEELIGSHPRIVFGKDDKTTEDLKSALKEKMSWQGPIVVLDNHKKQKVMYFNILPVYNFINEATYYACIGKSIEDEETIDACEVPQCSYLDNFVNTLFEQSTYLKDINNQLPTGVFRTDKKLNIVYSNCVAQQQFGLNKEESFLDNIAIEDHDFVKSMFKNCSSSQKINHMTYRLKPETWVGCDFWPIIEKNKIIGYAGSLKDESLERNFVKELQLLKSK